MQLLLTSLSDVRSGGQGLTTWGAKERGWAVLGVGWGVVVRALKTGSGCLEIDTQARTCHLSVSVIGKQNLHTALSNSSSDPTCLPRRQAEVYPWGSSFLDGAFSN